MVDEPSLALVKQQLHVVLVEHGKHPCCVSLQVWANLTQSKDCKESSIASGGERRFGRRS